MTTKKHQKKSISRGKRQPSSRRAKRKTHSSRRRKASNRSRIILAGILGTVFVLLLLGIMWQASSSGGSDLAPPEVLAQGESIYRENCVACHGDNGEGNIGSALNGSAHAWHHPDAQLLSFIRDGIPGTQMPAQRDNLSEEEIKAVISYIKSWWTPQQRQMQQAGQH